MSSTAVRREKKTRFLSEYGLYLAISSYIKPGAVHRFSPSLDRYDNLMAFVFSMGNVLDDVIEQGNLISRGKRGINEFSISSMLSGIKSLMVSLRPVVEERLIPTLFIASVVDVLHFTLRGELRGEQYFIYSSIAGDSVRDFFDLLKIYDRDARGILVRSGYTESNIYAASLLEIVNSLAREGRRDYENLLRHNISECVNVMERGFSEGEALNTLAIEGFASMLINDPRLDRNIKDSLNNALKLGGMRTREGSRALLELDRQMSARGIDTNDHLVSLLKCIDRVLLR